MKRDSGNQHKRRKDALTRLEAHYGALKAYWGKMQGGANAEQRNRLLFMEKEMKTLRDKLAGVEQ